MSQHVRKGRAAKERRRVDAARRQALRDVTGDATQIALLNRKLGRDYGARRERARLAARMEKAT